MTCDTGNNSPLNDRINFNKFKNQKKRKVHLDFLKNVQNFGDLLFGPCNKLGRINLGTL